MTEMPAAPAGPSATPAGSPATPAAPLSTPAAGVIKLLNWADYLSAEMLKGFEAQTGIRVAETYVERNDDFVARVRAGESYDVILPTDWAAEALLNAGLLQPLDLGLLPNWEHVTQPSFRSPPYDPGTSGAKYTSVCYFGTEGFAMLIDKAPAARNSWQTLYDPKYRGQIAMLDGSREVLGPALFLLAGDPNTTDQQLLDAAVSMAVAQKSLVAIYDTQSISQHIVDGTALVQCWDGDVAAAVSRGVAGVRFVLPDEGFRVWADAPCIPANAEHPVAAHRFLDHLLDPVVAARNADLTGYQPVVPAAEPLMRSLVRRSLRPTEEQLARGTFLRDLGPFNEAFERAYARVRAA